MFTYPEKDGVNVVVRISKLQSQRENKSRTGNCIMCRATTNEYGAS